MSNMEQPMPPLSAAEDEGINSKLFEVVPGDTSSLLVENVSKSFAARQVLGGVSFAIRKGEFVALLGPSGAGKTTLFRCLAGLAVPDAGAVRFEGGELGHLKGRARRRLAVVFQQFNLVGRLTALDNVLAGRLGRVAAWRGLMRRFSRQDRLLALECLDRVALLDHAMQRADKLSGGQQQRVAIARALAQQPQIIIADEPVASLDPSAGVQALDLLRGVVEDDGVGVVCSLHQIHFARRYADRIIGLSQGRLVVDQPVFTCDDATFDRIYGNRN